MRQEGIRAEAGEISRSQTVKDLGLWRSKQGLGKREEKYILEGFYLENGIRFALMKGLSGCNEE